MNEQIKSILDKAKDIEKNNPDEALKHYQEAEKLSYELGDQKALKDSLESQYLIFLIKNNFDDAMLTLNKEEQLCYEMNDKYSLQNCLGCQANTLLAKGDMEGSKTKLKERETICRDLGEIQGLITSLANHAVLLNEGMGHTLDALALLEEASHLSKDNNISDGVNAIEENMASIRARVEQISVGPVLTSDPFTSQFRNCLMAFAKRDYYECIQLAKQLILSSHVEHEIQQFLLISLQRTGKTFELSQFSHMLLDTMKTRSWEYLLLKLTLGEVDISEVLSYCESDIQYCQAHYYAGARLLSLGKDEEAKIEFRASNTLNVNCIESYLTSIEDKIQPLLQCKIVNTDVQQNILTFKEKLSNLYQEKQFEDALDFAEKIVMLCQEHYGEQHQEYVWSLNTLADVYGKLEISEKIEPLLIQSREIIKNILGNNHPQYVRQLSRLTNLYISDQNSTKAEPLLLKVMEIIQDTFGKEHTDYVKASYSLADIYNTQGNYSKSEPLLQQTTEILINTLGERHYVYARSLCRLAFLYNEQGKYTLAEPLLKKAIDITRQAVGEEDPDYLQQLYNLSQLYVSLGNYDQAEPLLIKQLELSQKKFGNESPEVATCISILAGMYHAQGKYSNAEPLYKMAIEITKKTLGDDNPEYAIHLNNLAQFYLEIGNYEKAEPLLRLSMEIRRITVGENDYYYASSLETLGSLYYSTNNYKKAEPLLRQALEIRRNTLPEGDPRLATTLNALAMVYKSLGNLAKAEPLSKQAVEIHRNSKGENNPGYAALITNLAQIYESNNRLSEAESLYIQAFNIFKTTLEKTHPHYINTLERLARLSFIMKNYEKAEPLLLETIEIYEQAPQYKSDIRYINHLEALADLYWKKDKFDAAEQLWHKVINLVGETRGKESPEYASCLNNFACLYFSIDDYANAEPLIYEAIEITRKIVGEKHLDYVTYTGGLAGLYYAMGKKEESKRLYEQIVTITQKMHGDSKIEYANILRTLAMGCHQMGNYEQAASLLQCTGEIQRSFLGENHNDYLLTLSNLKSLTKHIEPSIPADPNVRALQDNEVPHSLLVFKKSFDAYLKRDYSLCLRYARGLVNEGPGLLFLQLLLISLYRLNLPKDAELLADDVLEQKRYDQWENSLIRVTCGQIEGPLVIDSAETELQRCQAYYYTGIRLLVCEDVENAKIKFEECLATDTEILEKVLAQEELRFLSKPQPGPSTNEIQQKILHLHNQMTQAFKNDRYEEALKLAREARELAQRHLTYEHPAYADCLLYQATLYDNTGVSQKADSLIKQAIEILYKTLGEDHPEYISEINILIGRSRSAINDDNTIDFDTCIRRAIDLLPFSKSDSLIAVLLFGLQDIPKKENYKKYVKAALSASANYPAHNALVKVAVGQINSSDALAIVESDRQRCQVHYYAGTYFILVAQTSKALEEFEACNKIKCDCIEYERAKSYRDKLLAAESGDDFTDQFYELQAQLRELYDQKRFKEASGVAKQIHELARQNLDVAGSDYANIIRNLAKIYQANNDYKQAELMFQESININRGALGENHPLYVDSLADLARMYSERKEYKQAAPFFREVMKFRERSKEDDPIEHAMSLEELSSVLFHSTDNDDKAESLQLMQQVVKIRLTELGEHDPSYIRGLEGLATEHISLNNFEEVKRLISQVIKLKREVYGEDNADYVQSLTLLAELSMKAGENVEAESLFLEAIKIVGRLVGDQQVEYADRLIALGSFYSSMKRYSEAEPLLQQALEIKRAKLGKRHPEFAKSLNKIALLYDAMGDYSSAERLYQQAMEILHPSQREK